MGKTQLFFKI